MTINMSKYAECANKYATKYAQIWLKKCKKYAEYAKNMQNISDQ